MKIDVRPRESEVQKACREVLEAAGCRVERRNVGAMIRGGRLVRFGEPGAADLFGALPDGRHFDLEVKRPGGRPRLEQVRWLREANRRSPAFWVDDAAVLERLLPALAAGAVVEYLDAEWTYRVAAAGRRLSVKGPGGDFDLRFV